jgi:glycosyltransferase involved in cell wall biosynthesis
MTRLPRGRRARPDRQRRGRRGPEKTILATPRELEGSGYRAFALYLHAPGDTGSRCCASARAGEKDCELVALPDRWAYDPRTLQACGDLPERGVRVWHGHDYKSNFYGVLLRKELGLRSCRRCTAGCSRAGKTPLYFAIDRWSLRRYEQVMAVSQDLYDAALKNGVARERLTLVENAIDTDEFRRRAPTSASPSSSAPSGASPRRRASTLIEACERLAAKGREFELRIAGEGPQKEALAAQIARSKFASPGSCSDSRRTRAPCSRASTSSRSPRCAKACPTSSSKRWR